MEWVALPDQGGAGRSSGHECASESEAETVALESAGPGRPWLVYRVRAGRWTLRARAALGRGGRVELARVAGVVA
jgi:hypothetical protein